MVGNYYHFITHWRLKGNIHEVYEILNDPIHYPNWWGTNLLSVEEVQSGGQEKRFRMKMKGRLPYTLEWELVHTESMKPSRIISDAIGDFVGRGIWTLKQMGSEVDILFDWNIRTEKPFLRYFSWVLKPLFSANHNWVMEQARKGLIQEIRNKGTLYLIAIK
ncbi:MAG: polyketide cyclase [Candidatus Omnitrophica bacterium]|nr:polyketide cyclase [Candidatus Omnitrophota bacterium]